MGIAAVSYCVGLLDVAKSFWDSPRMPTRAVTAEPDRWEEVGRIIVHRRERTGMLQAQLAYEADVSQSVLSRLENGRPANGSVAARTLRRLSDAFQMPPETLEHVALGDLNEADVDRVLGENEPAALPDIILRIQKLEDAVEELEGIESRLAALEAHIDAETATSAAERDIRAARERSSTTPGRPSRGGGGGT